MKQYAAKLKILVFHWIFQKILNFHFFYFVHIINVICELTSMPSFKIQFFKSYFTSKIKKNP